MFTLQVLVLGLLSMALASPVYNHGHDDDHHDEHGDWNEHEHHYAPKHYKYEYGVHDHHTGDVKEAKETKEGDVVKGYYKLKEADGTTRIVHYTADKHNGFNAHVEKIGHAHYPEHHDHHEHHHDEHHDHHHDDHHDHHHDDHHDHHHDDHHDHHHDDHHDHHEYNHDDHHEHNHHLKPLYHHGIVKEIHYHGQPHYHHYDHLPYAYGYNHNEQPSEHDFHVYHDKHHAKSHQSVSMGKHY